MSKEIRTLFLVGLTLIAYASSIYFTTGSFIFPSPFNSFIFLAIALQFTFWHKKVKYIRIIVPFTGLLGILATQELWEIFLPIEKLEIFLSQPWIHWFLLLYVISLIKWAVFTSVKQKTLSALLITLFGALSFAYGYFSSNDIFIPIGFAIISASVIYKPGYKAYDLLWVLLLILVLSKRSTLFLD